MKSLALSILSLLVLNTAVASKASYYRVWQGFKKPQLSSKEFIRQLPRFMEATVDLYENRGLNQYLVAIPKANKPAYIPDEFALVALEDEASYRSIRATKEGKAYGKSHWDVFDSSNSRSSKFHNFYQDKVTKLENNHAYDLFGKPLDWTSGHTVFYLGLRKKGVSGDQFLQRLYKHVDLVKSEMESQGMRGYIVIANKNYEVAYINWRSKQHLEQAFQADAGKKVLNDAEGFLNKFQYQSATPYRASDVESGAFIRTLN